MPKHPKLTNAHVVRTERLSPSFQRVTITGADLANFNYLGYDQWFRLFIPQHPGDPIELPGVDGDKWWKQYLALDEAERPHCANYTVSEVRNTSAGQELDIDVVLHWDSDGNLAGAVANWAVSAQPGSPLALLDQGLIFDPGLLRGTAIIVCDETGVPAARGILRRLPADAQGIAVLEVPNLGDAIDTESPEAVNVQWVARDGVPGHAALEALAATDMATEDVYAYVVGESSLATGGRRALHRRGIPKAQITFSGYWKLD